MTSFRHRGRAKEADQSDKEENEENDRANCRLQNTKKAIRSA